MKNLKYNRFAQLGMVCVILMGISALALDRPAVYFGVTIFGGSAFYLLAATGFGDFSQHHYNRLKSKSPATLERIANSKQKPKCTTEAARFALKEKQNMGP